MSAHILHRISLPHTFHYRSAFRPITFLAFLEAGDFSSQQYGCGDADYLLGP
jgi:hypothetical protein